MERMSRYVAVYYRFLDFFRRLISRKGKWRVFES